MTSASSFLEIWAYIMIIIVCFTILVSILVYVVNKLIRKKRKKNASSFCFKNLTINSNNDDNVKNNRETNNVSKCFLCCCSASNNNKLFSSPIHSNNTDSKEENNNFTSNTNKNTNIGNSKIESNSNRELNNYNLLYQKKLIDFTNNSYIKVNESGVTVNGQQPVDDSTVDNSNKIIDKMQQNSNGIISYLLDRLNVFSMFGGRIVDDGPKQTYLTDSDKKVISQNAQSSKGSIIKKSTKNVSKRNASLPTSSMHSVKFKTTSKSLASKITTELSNMTPNDEGDDESEENYDSFVDEKYSSDENNLAKRKYSICSNTNQSAITASTNSTCTSRKNSTNSSGLGSSVYEIYKQKRAGSDLSSSCLTTSYSTMSSSKRMSVNQIPNSLVEPCIKLVAIEQQPNIKPNRSDAVRKNSSLSTTTSSSLSSRTSSNTGRRFSIVTTPANENQKFWVPPGIAQSIQFDRQRISLPNTSVYEINENESANAATEQSQSQNNDLLQANSGKQIVIYFAV